jgi:hypothetical protein
VKTRETEAALLKGTKAKILNQAWGNSNSFAELTFRPLQAVLVRNMLASLIRGSIRTFSCIVDPFPD